MAGLRPLGKGAAVPYTVSYSLTKGCAYRPAQSLESALAFACQFLKERRPDVTIEDGEGHLISGPDLTACCRGEKKLTADLRVI